MHGPAPAPRPGPPGPLPGALFDAIRQLRRGTVLVVGDAMLDRHVYGRVERVSPEAPVPVLTVEREVALPGGAGNVVRNLTALGAAVAFVSVVGDDQTGSDLTGLIGGQPGVEPWLLVQGGRATTTKTRFVAAGQQMLRADHEVVAAIHPRLADRLVRIAGDAVAATAVMVLSDYRKGVLAADTPARLIAAARTAGRKVVVDPKGGDHGRYAGADLILPDLAELAEATGLPVGSETEIAAAAAALRAMHGFGAVMVIRGEFGVTLVTGDGDGDIVHHLPSDVAEVVDPAGAGDAVVAVAAAGLAAGLPLVAIARLGALAAGIVLGKTGIAVVREDEFLEALTPGRLATRKMATRAEAAERVERWRRAGARVGFLVGSGAANAPELVARARSWCDRLVVALGDADGAAAELAELPGVDLIARFGGETPLELIRLLRPDVLVQDPGPAPFAVPGGEVVQEWGGTIRRATPEPETEPTAA
ncbi:PfkB family carbohydrate kinase [Paracraurococcus ruber]|uniref:Bifunctional heptose 7-phosphate kinase/heptose 1-phosphate adenyltransferase n=1 Tax=Paracraurococcus ruber TaxID=77675 RepID=A0ABS1D3G5_9PROT|nr:PfkB family carbohydrate kinase [Paracraurococcus ruber]MBK1661096.1 bifunctional heptose 7-phosphate kinase/heptose 1-phosphate adenyltransferase [Paracraurococcus ruber]TDG25718.1 bifunctional heptose 7-phosphate kinase/heptose 1-phosphate adenyltransferase [Paracraurococcus ruber]